MLSTAPYENAFNKHFRLYREAQRETHISAMSQHNKALDSIYKFMQKHGQQLNGTEREGFIFEPDPEAKGAFSNEKLNGKHGV